MIPPRQFDRLMRFVRTTFPADEWGEASLGLIDESSTHSAKWYAVKLEKLIHATGWQDPAAQPWNRRRTHGIGEVLPTFAVEREPAQ